MLSFVSTFLDSYNTNNTNFTKSVKFSLFPYIEIGIFGDKKQGIKFIPNSVDIDKSFISNEKIYELKYYKKMENGLLYMFDKEIRLKINIEKDILVIYIFSFEHNYNDQIYLSREKSETWKYIRLGNNNHIKQYVEIDHIFEYLSSKYNDDNYSENKKQLQLYF